MDEVDFAQERVESATASAVAGVIGALVGYGADECEDCGADECEDCGAEISAARRKAYRAARRCIDCQTRLETRRG